MDGLFADRSEEGVEVVVMRAGGGSWMVRVGFLCFLPIAEATKELNFEPAECSLGLRGRWEACILASWARLEPDGCSRRDGASLDLERDHQDLPCEEGKTDMGGKEGGKERVERSERKRAKRLSDLGAWDQ